MQSRPIFDSSVVATVERAQAGATSLCGIQLQNANAAVAYLQLFNAAATADVTIGTTAPTKVIKCEASVEKAIDFPHPPLFASGLCYAITTTPTGSTALGAACTLNIDLA